MSTAGTATDLAPRRVVRRVGTALPENTVMVGKGSGWASPFKAGETKVLRSADDTRVVFHPETPQDALNLFQWFLDDQPGLKEKVVTDLAGENLACWCPLDQLCHADVLLEVANAHRLPKGTPVRYWPMFKEGEGLISVTSSVVHWMRGSGEPIVWVEGHEAAIAMDRIELVHPG